MQSCSETMIVHDRESLQGELSQELSSSTATPACTTSCSPSCKLPPTSWSKGLLLCTPASPLSWPSCLASGAFAFLVWCNSAKENCVTVISFIITQNLAPDTMNYALCIDSELRERVLGLQFESKDLKCTSFNLHVNLGA